MEQVRSASLIFNPTSGPGDPDSDLATIQKVFADHSIPLDVFETGASPERTARKALARKPDVVMVAGGDGTVGSVAGVLANKNVPLAILPSGTANALAMALGIPRDLRKACLVVLSGESRFIDLARCNGKIMALLVGIGFEARLVKDVDSEAKARWGPLAYYVKGLAAQRELFEAEIVADRSRLSTTACAITIANAAPPSSPLAQGFGEVVLDDGRLDITIAGPETFMQTVEALSDLVWAMVTREPVESECLKAIRARRVTVNTSPPQPVVLDGEDIGMTPVRIVSLPKALKVIAPPRAPVS